ncbi:MAG: DUF89 family protein [Spirochaetes bacterium]|nr:DUF89 family protein [Spirochaetota bacterium]
MKLYLDCYPCFIRQALNSARMAGADEKLQREVVLETLKKLSTLSLNQKSPDIVKYISALITEIIGNNDPYKDIKKKSNDIALSFYPLFKEMIHGAEDPLLQACKISAAGNIIDFGAFNSVDIETELNKIPEHSFSINHFSNFADEVSDAKLLLFIGDNAGEIVFDKLLIEILKKQYPELEIIYAVRGGPVLNDVTAADAEYTGISKLVKVISSGSTTAGTILNECSGEFLGVYESSDIVISKGMGNYETLKGETGKNIYFILKIKCDLIARNTGAKVNEMIFKGSLPVGPGKP